MAFPSDLVRTKNWSTEILTDTDLEGQFDLIIAWAMASMDATSGHSHDGTSNQSKKLTPANLVIASQAQGDVLYASSATAWARLGAGTSGQFLKTQGAAANPIWATSNISPHYRQEMHVMQASTTTITVGTGAIDVNSTILSKTSNTTLTISTAGDWAGGVSLRATSTTAYVGIDSSGNLKMHTTAPSHADYALTLTAANNTKRYVSWSSTTYRVIGWFRMNATGSGELDTYGVSNILDGSVTNRVVVKTSTYTALGSVSIPNDDTIPQNTEGASLDNIIAGFVSTNVNNTIKITVVAVISTTGGDQSTILALFQDSTANALQVMSTETTDSQAREMILVHEMKAATTSFTQFKPRVGPPSAVNTFFNGSSAAAGRLFGGARTSMTIVEEFQAQLT